MNIIHTLSTRRAIVFAVIILLVLEAVSRSGWVWKFDAQSAVGQMTRGVDYELSRSPEPKYVYIGNSLLESALNTQQIAELTGTPVEDHLDLSLFQGSPIEFLYLWNNHSSSFANVERVIIAIEPRQINSIGNLNRKRYIWGLDSRIETDGATEKIDLSVGWASALWDTRQYWRGVINDLVRLNNPASDVAVDENGQRIRRIEPIPGTTTDEGIVAHAIEQLADYKLNQLQVDALDELVRIARAQGANVTLIEAPGYSVWWQTIRTEYPEDYARYREVIERINGGSVDSVDFEGSCGGWSDCFVDYSHTNRNGAQLFSRALADHIIGPTVQN